MAASAELLSSLLLLLWSSSVSCTDDNMTTTSATSPPIELCLDVTSLTISNASLPFTLDKYADMQGIVYAYAPDDEIATTISHTFDIAADDNATAADHSSATVPMSVGRIGCWTEPLFHALSLNFKVDDFYHTSLKAECNVETPPISEGSVSDSVTMHAAVSYEFGKAVVDVEYTWLWLRIQDVAPEATAAVADGLAMDVEDVAVAGLSNSDHADRQKKEGKTDWMFVAAVTSAILGAVVLCGVCVQQKLFTSAKGYEFIPAAGHGKEKLASIKRISLSVGRARDEQKPIMNAHPPCSYTF